MDHNAHIEGAYIPDLQPANVFLAPQCMLLRSAAAESDRECTTAKVRKSASCRHSSNFAKPDHTSTHFMSGLLGEGISGSTMRKVYTPPAST
jgi:hypothetical protein